MTELFENVPQGTRDKVKFWIERAMCEPTPEKGAAMLMQFRDSLLTEEEKDYLDFAFAVRMAMKNEIPTAEKYSWR